MRLAAIATVTMAAWNAAFQASPANRSVEVRRDVVGAWHGRPFDTLPTLMRSLSGASSTMIGTVARAAFHLETPEYSLQANQMTLGEIG
jgi:hypothetical protein